MDKLKTCLKLSKNQNKIDNIFNPNKDGISQWFSIKEIIDGGLRWSKNGNIRHNTCWNDIRYIWEAKRKTLNKTSEIIAIRTNGFSEEYLNNYKRTIREDIKKFHISTGCVVCGSHSALVIDHKNDLYNDPRVLSPKTQTTEDFQCLCTHCNLQKRQVCKRIKETGLRYKATNIPQLSMFGIDFIEGDETFDPKDPNAMVGTYWYDPVKFMEEIKRKVIEPYKDEIIELEVERDLLINTDDNIIETELVNKLKLI
jgi:5-methylcytosine-specific restriction endonuclease McrA